MNGVLDGWSIGRSAGSDWVDWGDGGNARAKVLAAGDGYVMALVEAQPGYAGTPHEHTSTEFLYVVDGLLVNQGERMGPGDGYVASAGSRHTEFRAEQASTYVISFRL